MKNWKNYRFNTSLYYPDGALIVRNILRVFILYFVYCTSIIHTLHVSPSLTLSQFVFNLTYWFVVAWSCKALPTTHFKVFKLFFLYKSRKTNIDFSSCKGFSLDFWSYTISYKYLSSNPDSCGKFIFKSGA